MKTRKNNKGFTLVELIVVMAIMAILVGALAPQVVKYVEKARVSKDLQVENTLFTAVQTAIASSEETVPTFSAGLDTTVAYTNSSYTTAQVDIIKKVGAEIVNLLADDMDADSELIAQCSSKVGVSPVLITYDASTEAISVRIGTLDPVTN